MNGDRLGFLQTRVKEIIINEFLVPEGDLEQMDQTQMEAALMIYKDTKEFLNRTGWGRDNPECSTEKYLTENRICRWVDGKFVYLSRIILDIK